MNVEELQPGDEVRTMTGAVAQIVAPTQDGEWILVRYIEADDPDLAGTETLCHKSELQELRK